MDEKFKNKIKNIVKDIIKEAAPPGKKGEALVKKLKKDPDVDNPYALAWHVHNKGKKTKKNMSEGGLNNAPECGVTDIQHAAMSDKEKEAHCEEHHDGVCAHKALTESHCSVTDREYLDMTPNERTEHDEKEHPKNCSHGHINCDHESQNETIHKNVSKPAMVPNIKPNEAIRREINNIVRESLSAQLAGSYTKKCDINDKEYESLSDDDKSLHNYRCHHGRDHKEVKNIKIHFNEDDHDHAYDSFKDDHWMDWELDHVITVPGNPKDLLRKLRHHQDSPWFWAETEEEDRVTDEHKKHIINTVNKLAGKKIVVDDIFKGKYEEFVSNPKPAKLSDLYPGAGVKNEDLEMPTSDIEMPPARSTSWGEIPAPEQLEKLMNSESFPMTLAKSDEIAYAYALGVANMMPEGRYVVINDGEEMHEILTALVNVKEPDELNFHEIQNIEVSSALEEWEEKYPEEDITDHAMSLASSIMETLGVEWI